MSYLFRCVTAMLINHFYEFVAFMINRMTWSDADAESFLEVDVKLNLTLEVVLIQLYSN